MAKKECYKVLKRLEEGEGGALVSAVAHNFIYADPRLSISYLPGEVVRPEVGMIFAFRDLKHALSFARELAVNVGVYEVWKANCGKLNDIGVVLPTSSLDLDSHSLESFWNEGKLMDWRFPPKGTVVTPWIEIKKKLWVVSVRRGGYAERKVRWLDQVERKETWLSEEGTIDE